MGKQLKNFVAAGVLMVMAISVLYFAPSHSSQVEFIQTGHAVNLNQ